MQRITDSRKDNQDSAERPVTGNGLSEFFRLRFPSNSPARLIAINGLTTQFGRNSSVGLEHGTQGEND